MSRYIIAIMNFTGFGITDYQYSELMSMDYNTLVTMLSHPITPYVRKNILHILTSMNDTLIQKNSEQMNSYNSDANTVFGDRIGTFNTRRKKDLTEQKHPAQIAESKPRSYLSASVANSFVQNSDRHMSRVSRVDPFIVGNRSVNLSRSEDDNFDDIVNGLTSRQNESDELDAKLARIQKLHAKISRRKKAKSQEKRKLNI